MKKAHSIIFILVTLLTFACTKEHTTHSGELPSCIQSLIDDDSEKRILTIQVQFVKGDFHYWVNTDDRHLDGAEDVLNSQCNLECNICDYCIRPKCLDNYNKNAWKIIWKR